MRCRSPRRWWRTASSNAMMAIVLQIASSGCSSLQLPGFPTREEREYRALQRRLGEDQDERRRLTRDCIGATSARDAAFQSDIAAAMGVDRGEAATAFCRRLILGITSDRLTYRDFASLQSGSPDDATLRKLADVVTDPGYAEEYGPLD